MQGSRISKVRRWRDNIREETAKLYGMMNELVMESIKGGLEN